MIRNTMSSSSLRTMRSCSLAVLLLIIQSAWAGEGSDQTVSLRAARVLVPADQPRFVSRAVEDLQKVVSDLAGTESTEDGPGPTIELAIARPAGGTPESFQIDAARQADGTTTVRITAADSAGLKFGLVELTACLQVTTSDVLLSIPLHIERKPLLATRGMYAHLHWAYRHPYALRSWTIEDWKRYLDLLTHLGFNTIQIWPMMELLPHPLSAEDREYLERYAEIVEYAHVERGMKVFIGSCPNSITADARGVPIDRREYWDFEKRLNPGDPAGLRRILEARSDLYRTIPNADGYWVIDSDPGGWPGSPPYDFVAILSGHRALIDQYGTRPGEQPLIYWMWYSWGTGSREENWRVTLAEAKRVLSEPWQLYLCLPEQFPVCADLGVLSRAIYFPYNLVETEPSAPLTELRLGGIEEAVRTARRAGLNGILGNAQTPLVQLPNIAMLADACWQDSRELDGEAALRRLAGRILGKDPDKLVQSWLLLAGSSPDECVAMSRELKRLAGDGSIQGSLGPIMADWAPRVVEDLTYLLEIHARAVGFAKALEAHPSRGQLSSRLREYLEAVLSWQGRTGYHNDRLICLEAYREPVSRALDALEREAGRGVVEAEIVGPACRPGNGPESGLCRQIIETVRGQRK